MRGRPPLPLPRRAGSVPPGPADAPCALGPIGLVDVPEDHYEMSPPVLVSLLLTAAGLLSVDLPRVRP